MQWMILAEAPGRGRDLRRCCNSLRGCRILSVGTSLKPPGRFECVLDGTGVASREVGDNHHVLDEPGGDAEGSRKLPQHGIAVAEIGTDHQVRLIKLARDESAVVAPLGQSVPPCAAYAGQVVSQAGHLVDLHPSVTSGRRRTCRPPFEPRSHTLARWFRRRRPDPGRPCRR